MRVFFLSCLICGSTAFSTRTTLSAQRRTRLLSWNSYTEERVSGKSKKQDVESSSPEPLMDPLADMAKIDEGGESAAGWSYGEFAKAYPNVNNSTCPLCV